MECTERLEEIRAFYVNYQGTLCLPLVNIESAKTNTFYFQEFKEYKHTLKQLFEKGELYIGVPFRKGTKGNAWYCLVNWYPFGVIQFYVSPRWTLKEEATYFVKFIASSSYESRTGRTVHRFEVEPILSDFQHENLKREKNGESSLEEDVAKRARGWALMSLAVDLGYDYPSEMDLTAEEIEELLPEFLPVRVKQAEEKLWIHKMDREFQPR